MGIIGFDGDIFIDGKSIKKEPLECKKLFAYIPDNPDLYNYMTGMQFLTFICDIYGIPQSERNNKIKELADKFEIYDVLGNKISSYSHGMKQKLAIVSAWVHSPKLILMDEPFVGLDPKASHTLKLMMSDILLYTRTRSCRKTMW